jgi:hypothetical protein
MDNSEDKKLTRGEVMVGLTFNPSGDDKVNEVKTLYARIIDLCDELRTEAGRSEKARLLSVAITEAQSAQMWAVKGVTCAYDFVD